MNIGAGSQSAWACATLAARVNVGGIAELQFKIKDKQSIAGAVSM
jgi:hypothetical protein